ncbi:hypothetical protein Dimus_035635 [Dionaea muscipula]
MPASTSFAAYSVPGADSTLEMANWLVPFLIELKDSKPAIGMTSLAPVQNPSSLVGSSVAFRLAFLSYESSYAD